VPSNPGLHAVDYRPEHADALVRMWRTSFERALGVVDPHPIEEQRAYLDEQVVPNNEVLVVLAEAEIVAFLAFTSETIAQLYVHPAHQGKGIGSALLSHAKERSTGRLRLFTFERNAGARRFYERHGFRLVGRGFEETWQLADLEYEWRREPG
jgi:ribosomal protein S18 acetylase RimI-like enzyme